MAKKRTNGKANGHATNGEALQPDEILDRIDRHPDPRSLRTPERAVAVATALKAGATRKAAASHAGIDTNTLWRWTRDDPDMAKLVEEAEGAAEMAYVLKVYAATNTSWQAAAWWLERRRPTSYGRRDRLDVTVEARTLAADIAEAEGLDPAELIAGAQRILTEHRERSRAEPDE